MFGTWSPDGIHIILMTGFVSTVVGIAVRLITVNSISSKYVTKEEFTRQQEVYSTALQQAVKELIRNCEVNRQLCPLSENRKEIIEIRKDISEIKQIQHDRTRHLERKAKAEFNIWRKVLDFMKVSVDEQNKLLEGLS